jgi:hypothetical protein
MTTQQIVVDMLRPIIKECHSTSQGPQGRAGPIQVKAKT